MARMAIRPFLFVTLGLLVSVGACSDKTTLPGPTGTGGGGAGQASALPCAVDDILELRCKQCHDSEPQFGAPMPLSNREDLLAKTLDGSMTVIDLAIERMKDDGAIMPPPPNPAATAAEIAVLESWVDAGHPAREAGAMCDGGGGNGGGGGGPDCEPDLQIQAAAPFSMPATSLDEQVCFGIDIPGGDAKRHITMIAPKIDNSKILHHILLLKSPTAVSPEPTKCSVVNAEWKLLYAWGPGTPALSLPSAAGLPLAAGESTHFVLQVHYSNLTGLENQVDQSGLELCTTTDLREHDADIMALGSANFSGIAPNATSELSCSSTIPKELAPLFPITVYQSWPHMHQKGHRLSTMVEHDEGETSTLVDVDNYSFDYQITYPTDMKVDVGAKITTTCAWKNNTPNAIDFGEETSDEMCFNFISYYPKIDVPQWHWLLPAASADCGAVTVE